MIHPRLNYAEYLDSRNTRMNVMSVADIKPFLERLVKLPCVYERVRTWELDVGLAEASSLAAPLNTLFDRQAFWVREDTWVWEYKGRHQDGVECTWPNKEEAHEGFTPLQRGASLFVESVPWRKSPDSTTGDARRARKGSGPMKTYLRHIKQKNPA